MIDETNAHSKKRRVRVEYHRNIPLDSFPADCIQRVGFWPILVLLNSHDCEGRWVPVSWAIFRRSKAVVKDGP